MTPTRMTYHSKTKYMAWVFMKSLFSQWLEEKAPKMLNCCQLKFFTHFSWGTNIHMGTTITNLIPATFGHWGLFLLVACFHWEKGSRKKNRTPFSISPTVSESPDQGPSKNTGVCPKKIGSRGNCPSFVGCNTIAHIVIHNICNIMICDTDTYLSLIHIWRCRRYSLCRSRWSPYH